MIAYEEELSMRESDAMQYHLPFDYKGSIEEFSLHTKVYRAGRKPQFVEQPDGSLSFSGDDQLYEASMRKRDFKPEKSLTINLPKNIDIPEVVLQENMDGSHYFLINAYKKGKSTEKVRSNRIGIIWDNSLSGLQRDKKKELDLLDMIIKQKRNVTIELGLLNITFKKAGSFNIKNGDWSELRKYLENVTYDGGTDLSKLNEKILSAGEYLFFTDGMSTFGENEASLKKPVYIISSSAKADYSASKDICLKSGGKHVNLINTTVQEAYKTLSSSGLQFLGIQEKKSVSEVYPSMPTEFSGHVSVAGIVNSGTSKLTLLFGRNGEVESSQTVELKKTPNDIKVHRIWAQKKIAEMDIRYEQNKEDIELLGRQFGIVTRNTSLIVLENVADYIQYEITPPEELLAAYNEMAKNNRIMRENRMDNLLYKAVTMVENLKDWWNTDFEPVKLFPVPKKEDSINITAISAETHEDADSIDIISSEDDDEAEPVQYIDVPVFIEEEAAAQELFMIVEDNIDVSSYGIMSSEDNANQAQADRYVSPSGVSAGSNRRIVEAAKVARIKLPEIKSDKEYIEQLRSAGDAYATYLSLRDNYMGTPGFYFDVSDYFYKNNQKEKGLLVLSNLAELDIENADLFKTLAYRLKENGEYAYELFVTGKILSWRPMDVQSHRDHALALQDNGRYQESLDRLYSILNASYSMLTTSRNQGIEEIIVCEINNLISLHRNKLDLSAIDSKIIADLPVNVRVVINWNKDNTDIDLWVTDPRGEKCYYKHNRTSIGGRISKDFTQGFGPEQFLLKKAVNGTYKIETNFFGERQFTLSGPTTIMGEIYLYYSDGREERRVITFQNGEKGKEKNGVLIGEFVFE